jgi:hypothetical protein
VSPGLDFWSRRIAAAGALGFVAIGLWAFVDPESSFDRVATFEPYNQHPLFGLLALVLVVPGVLRWRRDAALGPP